MTHEQFILILDFGSQYTQLIARRVRELGVYSEIKPFSVSLDEIKRMKPMGVILSGGPASVYADEAPLPSRELFDLDTPILGICYGLQTMAFLLGGEVERAPRREYGRAELTIDEATELFAELPRHLTVWMSHGDPLTQPPPGYRSLAPPSRPCVTNEKKSSASNSIRRWCTRPRAQKFSAISAF